MMKPLWTDAQIDRLARWQAANAVHPFTCPGEAWCPRRELIPTRYGWVCACGAYTQTWVYSDMLERDPPTAPREMP